MGFFTRLLDSVLRLPVEFAGVATRDPVSGLLLAVGTLLTLASVAVFGYLSAGAVLSVFVEPPSGVSHGE